MLQNLAKGAAWMVAFRFAERALSVVSTIVLARLLLPDDFGLIAMAMTFVGFIELLGAFGFDNALIQRRVLERGHYDTAFTLNAALGLFCGLLIAAAAVPTARFYHEPRLVEVLLCLGVSSLIQGFENVGTVDFRRGLEFHREFLFLMTKRLLAFVITMAAAWTLRSYWALVIGIIAGRVATVMFSYFYHPYRPRFSLAASRELMSFSSWLLITNVLTFISVRTSHLIIGRIGSLRALGLYTMSYEIATMPTSELLAPVNRAVFPAFAKIAGNRDELRRAFLAMVGAATMLTIPAAFGIAAIAEPLVLVALSTKWADAVPLIEILAFLGAAGALINCATPAYLAMGKPHIATLLFGGRLVLTVPALIYAGTRYGVMGIAWVELVSLMLAVPVSMTVVARIVGITFADTMGRAWRPLLSSAAMFWIVRAFLDFLERAGWSMGDLLTLLSAVTVGAVTYVALVGALWFVTGRVEGFERDLIRFIAGKLRVRAA